MTVAWKIQQGVYTCLCGLGFVAAFLPIYGHLRAWNSSTVLWSLWCGIGGLVFFINGIIWHDNVENWAPVWCDIVTRFNHVQAIGILTATALLNHRLYKVFKMSSAGKVNVNKQAMMFFDIGVGLGVPTTFAGTYWFIQGHRFNIVEGIGCQPATPATLIWLLTFGVWPIIISFISACFGVMTIHLFVRHRRSLSGLLPQASTNTPDFDSSLYTRLMIFASVDAFLTLPLTVVILTVPPLKTDWYPYRGLADLHLDFSRIGVFTADTVWYSVPGSVTFQLLLPAASTIASSFVFFIFFGTTKEARATYRGAWLYVGGWLLWISRQIRSRIHHLLSSRMETLTDRDVQGTKATGLPAEALQSSHRIVSLCFARPPLSSNTELEGLGTLYVFETRSMTDSQP